MKAFFKTLLVVLLCIILILTAVCIGTVKEFKAEREALLTSCQEIHANAGFGLEQGIEKCELAAEIFDEKLEWSPQGVIALICGVQPVSDLLSARHELLVEEWEESLPSAIVGEIGTMVKTHLDLSLSLGKVVLTVILLLVIFGGLGRRGFTLGKLLAGIGLFKLWKKK